ncbi:unnamed protein product [Pleuronectes platessa]|uniref:Uncharacterized protein n=1 Tax=Pleuronectes platessa TaxID=8262 RepID=A0A9N7V4Q9_PLEPL|nr:unnamed protein product [Pleuronectes platessa]
MRPERPLDEAERDTGGQEDTHRPLDVHVPGTKDSTSCDIITPCLRGHGVAASDRPVLQVTEGSSPCFVLLCSCVTDTLPSVLPLL